MAGAGDIRAGREVPLRKSVTDSLTTLIGEIRTRAKNGEAANKIAKSMQEDMINLLKDIRANEIGTVFVSTNNMTN